MKSSNDIRLFSVPFFISSFRIQLRKGRRREKRSLQSSKASFLLCHDHTHHTHTRARTFFLLGGKSIQILFGAFVLYILISHEIAERYLYISNKIDAIESCVPFMFLTLFQNNVSYLINLISVSVKPFVFSGLCSFLFY